MRSKMTLPGFEFGCPFREGKGGRAKILPSRGQFDEGNHVKMPNPSFTRTV
jgi:hypothetical protein